MAQTSYKVNVEIVVPGAKGRLVHFFKDEGAWHRVEFGHGLYSAASLIQSDFTAGERDGERHGNLEVVALPVDRRGFDLYWRNSATWEWIGPQAIV